MSELKRKDVVYYTKIIPTSGIYDVLELIIRTVKDDWFVGIEKRDRQAFLFKDNEINKTIFVNRKEALKVVQEAEKNRKHINEETFYEEF